MQAKKQFIFSILLYISLWELPCQAAITAEGQDFEEMYEDADSSDDFYESADEQDATDELEDVQEAASILKNNSSPQEAHIPKPPLAGKAQHKKRFSSGEDSEVPSLASLSEIPLINKHDVHLYFGGSIKEDFFFYNRVYTLRSDYNDRNDFFRHKLNMNFMITQGENYFKKPSSQAYINLANYIYWQNESAYMPMVTDPIQSPGLTNVTPPDEIRVRTAVPLIFAQQAWFKLNFDAFAENFKHNPTFLQIGFFPYSVGRGLSMGSHGDLAVDMLGWERRGVFSRYPAMPPGILLHTDVTHHVSLDFYYMLWRETNASISDTLQPQQRIRLGNVGGPERGCNKDRNTFVFKAEYSDKESPYGDITTQPYFIYTSAPEQKIELEADASSDLFTAGLMVDVDINNLNINVEIAGQCGEQRVHAIDRNITQLKQGGDGSIKGVYSHVNLVDQSNVEKNPALQPVVSDRFIGKPIIANNPFEPDKNLDYVVNYTENRTLNAQSKPITLEGIELGSTTRNRVGNKTNMGAINSGIFGNQRFRKDYKLAYQGFMALADISYTFEEKPFKLAGAVGYIGGDNYPYNTEVSKTYHGFIPQRSRYQGHAVQNVLIFDRLDIPRPLNIAYRTLSAPNNSKDMSNLKFFGLGGTWYPQENRKTMEITADVMFLWEVADLKKWDASGRHYDTSIEDQLERLRNTLNGVGTKFQGWESNTFASRMLGTEIDLKLVYRLLDHCGFFVKTALFIPGQLYTDLLGQPNDVTHRTDELGFEHFDSLGNQTAFAFISGLSYQF